MRFKIPYIIIIDFYSVVLGDYSCCIKEIKLLGLINKLFNTNFIPDFTDEMKSLIRPEYETFINNLKTKYKNVEIYLYLSTSIFDIKYDYEHLYNIHNCFDTIIYNLNHKYKSLETQKKQIYDSHFFIIADEDIDTPLYNDKIIRCPKYEYEIYYDIPKKLIEKYKINPDVFNNKEILEYCAENNINIHNKNGDIYQADELYQRLRSLYLDEYSKTNNNYYSTTDKLFSTLDITK
jgi:hypothetical protein